MAGQSISAHADAATVARLRQAAAREGRSPSQITASSLRFYLALPAAVRASLRDIDALGTDEDRHNLTRAIARIVASAQCMRWHAAGPRRRCGWTARMTS